LFLLMHVKVGVRILQVTHVGVWTLLKVAVSSVSVRSTSCDTILALQASHGKVVRQFTKTRIRSTLFAVGA
jgi:hypothetical protein